MKKSKKLVRFEYLDISEYEIAKYGIEGREWKTEYTPSDYPIGWRLMDIYDVATTLRKSHEYGAAYFYTFEGDTRYIFVREAE